MTEMDLLLAVLDLCKLRHCMVHHCRPASRADGSWRTPIQGDAGFVDLVIAGVGGVLFRELKGERGRLAPDQRLWVKRLATADVAVWKPADLASGRIDRELQEVAR